MPRRVAPLFTPSQSIRSRTVFFGSCQHFGVHLDYAYEQSRDFARVTEVAFGRTPEPTPEEKALLDRELEEYQRNPDVGSSWEEVKERVRKPTRE